MRYLTFGFLLTACFAVSGLAEESSPIGIGVKGGVPLNDAFVVRGQNPVSYIADTHRYIVGPYVELRLPAGFGIELDALYQTYEYRQVVPAPVRDQNSHDWQFPLVVKYKFLPGPVKPYLEAGAASILKLGPCTSLLKFATPDGPRGTLTALAHCSSRIAMWRR
jgi:hypothetical protein